MSRMRNKAELKDSGLRGVGAIPIDWKVSRVRDLFDEITDRYHEGETYLPLLSVSEYYGVAPRKEKINEGDVLTRAATLDGYKKCMKGDIVSNIMLAWKGSLGRSPENGIVSPSYCVYRPRKNVNSRYYHYLFRTVAYQDTFRINSTGLISSRLRLYTPKFYSIKVPYPSLLNQEVIVAYLDDHCARIDALVDTAKASIKEYEILKQSIIYEAVTKGLNKSVEMKDSKNVWYGQIPVHWEIHKISWDYSVELGKMLDQKRIKGIHLHPYLRNVDVRWDRINFDNLAKMDFDDNELERYGVLPGDLMICEGGEIGKCNIIPDNFPNGIYYQKALYRVRAYDMQKNNPAYLRYLITFLAKSGYLNDSVQKATIAHLPAEKLKQLRVPVPPIKEQKMIVRYLDKRMDTFKNLRNEKESLISDLEAYKKSLIYEVVTGKREV